MNTSESLAKHVVEKVRRGVTVKLHDLGTAPGQYDFDLVSAGKIFGAMEVTAAVVERSAAFIAILKKWNYQLIPHMVAMNWLLVVAPQAVNRKWLKQLRAACDDHLAKLEARGINEFYAETGYRNPEIKALANLGVVHGAVMGKSKPGISLTESGGSVIVKGPQHVVRAIEMAAAEPDNLSKLQSAARTEKHLFVWIDTRTSYPAWASLNDCKPGPCVPHLPTEITHSWAATWTRGSDIICWLFDRKKWSVLGPFPAP